jgi:peptidoglycan hydrolase-like protein with peptidoglycan-binding domain
VRRRLRVVVTATSIVVVAAVGAAAAGVDLTSKPSSAAQRSALPPATTKVTRQTLTDTVSDSGTLSHGTSATITNRLTGTVTWLPATGATVSRGKPIYEVDDNPVILLYGTLPAYRTLGPGDTGPDVLQLERNLHALGYRGFTVDDTYSSATATAVKKWQEALGLTETGTVDLGRVAYAKAAVRVDTVKVGVGDVAQPGLPVLTATGRPQVAVIDIDVADAAVARKGAAVKLELPDDSTIAGKVASTASVIIPGDNGGADTTKIAVTVAIKSQTAVAGLDQATVTGDFTSATADNVLAVSISALLALTGGGYGLEEVDGSTTRIVPVTTGLFTDGMVEVSGGDLHEGMTVGTAA